MKAALEKLKEFHRVFAAASRETPGPIDRDTMMLRISLIEEEFEETLVAMRAYHLGGREADLVEVADGLADLCYVVIGTAVAYGIPLDKVFDEVHRSNMAKAIRCEECQGRGGKYVGGGAWEDCASCKGNRYVVRYREDGKVLKPEGWTAPDVKKALGI